MSEVRLSAQQKTQIAVYRKQHNISPKVSDNAVAQMISGGGAVKEPSSTTSQTNKSAKTQQKPEYNPKSLGLKDTKGARTKVKSKNGTTYTVVGNATNGRKIVKDSKGQLQVLAGDGTLLNKDYVAKDVKKTNQAAQAKIQKENAEYKSLGLQNKEGAGTKVKSKGGNTYTVVGTGENGRKIVKDSKGQTQVLAADGTVLKKDYVVRDVKSRAVRTNSKSAQQATLETMQTQLKTAQKSFQKQLDQDGWAGDVADGVSVLWGSDNRASKVRIDLNTYSQNIQQLQKAAKNGDAAFNAKFKQLYGKDFDQKAMADYIKNSTQKNYEKAFGTKNDIKTRVDKYNKSQQQGAEAVKTTAKIGAGIAIGCATGGAGLVVVAAGTAAASIAIEETDRLNITDAVTKGEVNFREGTDHKKILKNAAWDGASVIAGGAVGKVAIGAVKGTTIGAKAARAAINTAGDVAVGTAQEYAETGTVTAQGIVSNAAMSAVGGAVVSGTLKGVSKGVKKVKNFAGNKLKGSKFKVNIDPNLKAAKGKTNSAGTGGKISAQTDIKHTQTTAAEINTTSQGAKTNELNQAAGKKAYVKPETRQLDITTESDIMASPGYGANGKPIAKYVELKATDGWRNFKTQDGEITVLNSNGTLYAGDVGGTARQVQLKRGETKILGQTSDGLDIAVTRNANGEYSVQHLGEKKSFWSKMFGGKKAQSSSVKPQRTNSDIDVNPKPKQKSATIVRNRESEIARTADGNPITATIKEDNFVITKDGKKYEIPIETIRESGEFPIHETSTNTDLICTVDKFGRVSVTPQTPDIDVRTQHSAVEQPTAASTGAAANRQVSSGATSIESLANLRRTNEQAYSLTTNKELAALQSSNPQLYAKLEQQGVLKGLDEPGGNQLPERVLQAIQLENKGKTLVTNLADNADISNISQHIGNGEVCSANGKLYVNDNGTAVELSLTQEKFEELFPPLGTALIQQSPSSKTCWLLSSISATMDAPKGRVEMYKRFVQDGNDIIVKSPSSSGIAARFVDGKVPSASTAQQVDGSEGIKMLELAAAIDGNRNKANADVTERIVTNDKYLQKGLETINLGGTSPSMGVNKLGRFEKTVIGKGGQSHSTLTKEDLTRMESLIKETANDPNCATLVAMNAPEERHLAWGLMDRHATKIIGYDPATNMVDMVDQIKQGGTGITRKIPLEDMMKYIANLTTTNFNPKISTLAQAPVVQAAAVKPAKRQI